MKSSILLSYRTSLHVPTSLLNSIFQNDHLGKPCVPANLLGSSTVGPNLVLLQEYLLKNPVLCTRIVMAIPSILLPVMLLGAQK